MIRHAPPAAWCLAALVVWAPLPFASAPPRFAAPLAIAALTVLALVVANDRRLPPRRLAIAAASLAAIALLGFLQSLEWPVGLVQALFPSRVELARESAALAGAPAPTHLPLSLAPGASRFGALLWLLPAAGLLLAGSAARRRAGRRLLAVALLGGALVQVALGAQLLWSGSDRIWGVETPYVAPRLHGTFVNPNHLAVLLEIALAVAAAWTWWSVRRSLSEAGAEGRILRVGPPALLGLALLAGLGLTGSRAGWVAALVGMLVTLGVAASGRRRRWTLGVGALALVGALAVAGAQGSTRAAERLVATSNGEAGLGARLEASARTLELWRRSPWVGVGLGGFRSGFPLVQGPELSGLWRHAHDDWAELAATTGLLGAALFAAGLAAVARSLVGARRRARRGEDRAAIGAAAGALTAVGMHSLVDFGLTMPANALALATVVGAAAVAGRRTRTELENRPVEGRSGVLEMRGVEGSGPQPPEATEDQLAESPASKPSANST